VYVAYNFNGYIEDEVLPKVTGQICCKSGNIVHRDIVVTDQLLDTISCGLSNSAISVLERHSRLFSCFKLFKCDFSFLVQQLTIFQLTFSVARPLQ